MDLFDVGFIVYIYNILYIINIYIYKYIYNILYNILYILYIIFICINIFVYIFTNVYISTICMSDKVIVTYFLLAILILYMKLVGNDDPI